jgi:RNA polymerase sigma-70 factor (ECF subfamily)
MGVGASPAGRQPKPVARETKETAMIQSLRFSAPREDGARDVTPEGPTGTHHCADPSTPEALFATAHRPSSRDGRVKQNRRARPTVPFMESDAELLVALHAGDEQAFVTLVNRYQGSLLRVARTFVPSDAVAEEVVQDTWMGVVRGIDRFEGRSSFKTWLFRILVNRARTSGVSEHRHLPLDPTEPAVGPDRFDRSGAWVEPIVPWESDVDDRLLAESWGPALRSAIDTLPGRQREVVLLRDIEGLPAENVCAVLDISEGNQRVLLHRGRTKLRNVLADEIQARGTS